MARAYIGPTLKPCGAAGKQCLGGPLVMGQIVGELTAQAGVHHLRNLSFRAISL